VLNFVIVKYSTKCLMCMLLILLTESGVLCIVMDFCDGGM